MKLRIKITKDDSIRFISHLEYIRTIERAIRRAKLPAAYSEGFNPHLKFSLASALGVGVASKAEFVEVELAEAVELKSALQALQASLPRGIGVLEADLVTKKTGKLMALTRGASYLIKVPCLACDWQSALDEYNNAASIIFAKALPKEKYKTKDIEVKHFVPKITGSYEEGIIELSFDCAITPTGSMKAIEVLQVLQKQLGLPLVLEKADILRTDLYTTDEQGKKQPLLNNHD
ncbi:MAG TPA: DUF2344 domain-containing protein [Candidatus Avacidaminococcus intestinavium]|uniref:DUF2344 domain-containing protein n=1 Tax=Candidatus Avacidaminococcus intestinavium TaxID=2840684 RepID=A0A9D1MRG5_9FIRM|nr:DUF2344 domain-containing protein [Candidatus Avacidaminococcus intestinavium]